jgi:predicted DNA-binding transcriptional regulator YafY
MKKKSGEESGQSLQARRVVWMLKKLQNGYKFTAKDFKKEIDIEFGEVSLRTVQRDLQLLQECETLVESYQDGKSPYYYYSKVSRRPSIPKIESSELLSFHILKAYLKNFKGTMIEAEATKLSKKLDYVAPEDVFLEESLYWDKNIGQFDYTDFDPLIRRVIYQITNKKWADIQYRPVESDESRLYTAFFRSIFTYAGYLYVVAYLPVHNSHVAFAIHRLEAINEKDNYQHELPDFDLDEFAKIRFGVYWGQTEDVELYIQSKYAHYFENRKWHTSQRFATDRNGNLTIRMTVPIATDFVAWLLSWGDLITVRKPQILIDKVVARADKILNNYE